MSFPAYQGGKVNVRITLRLINGIFMPLVNCNVKKYMFFFEPKIIHVEDPIGACQTPMVIIIHLDSNVLQSQDFVAFIFNLKCNLHLFDGEKLLCSRTVIVRQSGLTNKFNGSAMWLTPCSSNQSKWLMKSNIPFLVRSIYWNNGCSTSLMER